MEDWVLEKISNEIYTFGEKTKETIKKLKLENGTTSDGQEARYVDLFQAIQDIENHERVKNRVCSSVYTTVKKDENGKISSVEVWFKKDKNELLEVNDSQEYDSSEKMWEFYDLIYKDDFKGIERISAAANRENSRYYKKFNEITFGGEVDFNFNVSNVAYLKNTVKNETLFSDNDKNYKKLKDEIINLIIKASNHHHSVENVSMMASTGKMQITKQSIGNDRFDVFVYAIDEYCKGNTAWLLAHCTPENRAALCEFLEKICSKDGKLCSDEYYRKIYKITDKELIDDLKRSGKRSIDSVKRVLEYISLAYRVWIHRAKHYEKEYPEKYQELNGFSSEKLIEEYKNVVGVMQEL